MAPRHLLLLVTVCALWGLNSIAAAVALQFLSPLWLTMCRSGVLATPAALSVRLPRRYWLPAAIYGIGTFGIQFPLYYEALRAGVPAGVSSVIAQTGVIWSLVLSRLILREQVGLLGWSGCLLAFAGMVLLGWPQQAVRIPPGGVAIGVFGAFFGAAGLIAIRRAPGISNLALNVWGSLFALPVLALAASLLEGNPLAQIRAAFSEPKFLMVFAFQSLVASAICFPAWTRMMARYGISRVVPFSLLVPIFGVTAATMLLDEQWTPRMMVALGIIVSGLATVQLLPNLLPRLRPPPLPADTRPAPARPR